VKIIIKSYFIIRNATFERLSFNVADSVHKDAKRGSDAVLFTLAIDEASSILLQCGNAIRFAVLIALLGRFLPRLGPPAGAAFFSAKALQRTSASPRQAIISSAGNRLTGKKCWKTGS
jgi:hypothetical protein